MSSVCFHYTKIPLKDFWGFDLFELDSFILTFEIQSNHTRLVKMNYGKDKRQKNSIETSQRVPHTGTNSTRGDLAS